MRFARRAPLLLILLSAVLAGCGGDRISAEEVPGEPAALAIPSNEDAAPGAAAQNEDDAEDEETSEDEDEDATATATAEPGTSGGASTGAGTGGTTGGTGAGTATPQPTAAPTEAPAENTGGAQADEGLDQFCADNPGAC